MTDGLCMGHPRCAIPPCRDPLATIATDSVLRTSITITSVQCRAVLALLYHLGRCVRILNTAKMEKLNKARGEASFQFASRMPTHSCVSSSWLNALQHSWRRRVWLWCYLVNELEENITWFESHGEEPENVQIYNEHNEGCIGEEDGVHGEAKDTEMSGEVIIREHWDGRWASGNSARLIYVHWCWLYPDDTAPRDSTIGTVKRKCKDRSCTQPKPTMSRPWCSHVDHDCSYGILQCRGCLKRLGLLFQSCHLFLLS